MSRRNHDGNAMHPRNAIPFAGRGHYRQHCRPDPRRGSGAIRSVALVVAMFSALAFIAFFGLSGGFRP